MHDVQAEVAEETLLDDEAHDEEDFEEEGEEEVEEDDRLARSGHLAKTSAAASAKATPGPGTQWQAPVSDDEENMKREDLMLGAARTRPGAATRQKENAHLIGEMTCAYCKCRSTAVGVSLACL